MTQVTKASSSKNVVTRAQFPWRGHAVLKPFLVLVISFGLSGLTLNCSPANPVLTAQPSATTDIEATVRISIEQTSESESVSATTLAVAIKSTVEAENTKTSTPIPTVTSTSTPVPPPTPTAIPTATPTPLPTPLPTPVPEPTIDQEQAAALATAGAGALATATAARSEELNVERTVAASTVRARMTATAISSPWERSYVQACEVNSELELAWRHGGNVPEFTFDEEIIKSGNSIGISEYETFIPNAYMEAEFLVVDDAVSFGFRVRNFADPEATANKGYASDYIVITKNGYNWEWRHHVRNRFINSLGYENTLAASGSLTGVLTGPRGWNTFGVYFNGTEGGIVFNGTAVTTLVLDEVDLDVFYRSGPIAGHYSNEPTIAQPLRNARLLCP